MPFAGKGILGPLRILLNPLAQGVRMNPKIAGNLGLDVAGLGDQLDRLDLEGVTPDSAGYLEFVKEGRGSSCLSPL